VALSVVIPTQLDWRPLVRTDLLELTGLLTAIELHDDPSERHSLDELYERFESAYAEPERNAMVGWAGETPIAYGWNCVGVRDTDPRRVWMTGGVHPGWRRLGHGRQVLSWQMTRARSWYAETLTEDVGRLQMIGHVDETHHDRMRLFRRFGFHPLRWYADMSRPLTGPLPRVAVPDGIKIVRYSRAMSEDVRIAHNAAFADHWGSQPVEVERWQEECTRSSFRPEWSWVALADSGNRTGAVAGYAMSSAYPQDWDASGIKEGWTDRLGVRPEHRGRGLAKAMLVRTMESFRAAGLDAAGLGVDADNPTGASGLYQSMGYLAGDTVVMYARDETPAPERGPCPGG